MDREQVIDAGLALLAEVGLDGLTMRKVAQRLGVQLNTVYWHIAGKPQLLDAMSDRIVAGCADEPLPADWQERIRVLAHRHREAMLRHRDGGRVVAGRYYAGENTLALGEAVSGTLLNAGFTPQVAAWTAWSLQYFTLGLVQEEQAAATVDLSGLAEPLKSGRYPALAATVAFQVADNFTARFDFGLDLLLGSLEQRR